MKKRSFRVLVLIVLFVTVGCSKKIQTNIEYDSIKLEVGNVLNAGCYEEDNDTYFTHNMQDKHIYNFDYKNKIESIKTDNWVGYNTDETQYISSDSGLSFVETKELSSKVFENSYRDFLTELLEYIDSSEKNAVVEKESTVSFEVNFEDEEKVFEIIKRFGTVNLSEKLKQIKTTVTIDDNNNVNKIVFDITSSLEESNTDSCYVVTWTLSSYDQVEISLPDFSK